jgi:hypothetical protein
METVLVEPRLSDLPKVIATLEVLMRDFPKGEEYAVVFDIDDTLVRDDSASLPEVVALLKQFAASKYVIGLVTARHESMREFTLKELAAIGITYSIFKGENLMFCPQQFRTSFTAISKWKQSARYFLKVNSKRKLLCTVGDQWTDLITIESDKDRAMLDDAYGPSTLRLMRLNDGLCIFGIKLPSEDAPSPSFTIPQESLVAGKDQSFVSIDGGVLVLN